MRTCAECILCLLTRDLASVPPDVSGERKAVYQREVLRMIADSDPALCTPQLSARVDAIFARCFGQRKQLDFEMLKSEYNRRMLLLEPRLWREIEQATDPLAHAMKLARAGNYIDFGAMHEVDDALLSTLLANAQSDTLNDAEYAHFRSELAQARKMVYLTDNAGEIVLDKLLIRLLQRLYPALGISVLTRGMPTVNDATVDDARAVGLAALVPVVGNGNGLPGTVWDEISEEAQTLLTNADVLLAKGQANFETLSGCGLNLYYLLLCKCDYFVRRFQAPRLTGLFVNERRLPTLAD